MKKRNLNVPSIAAGLAVLIAFPVGLLVSGCEVESASKVDVQVRPAHADLAVGQSIELTASGWEDFRWSLSQPASGTLSATVGRQVVYTATRNPGVTQGVQAQAITPADGTTPTGSPAGTNVAPRAAWSATSRISHR